jgi:hypothetical protein
MDVSLLPVPSEVVTELPRARTEAATGQRFTVLHEFKQLVDHGHAGNLYIGNRRQTNG